MNFTDKWLEKVVALDTYNDEFVITLSDFQALMETHAIMPRELSDSIINKTPCSNIRAGVKRKIYKAMIKAAENDQ